MFHFMRLFKYGLLILATVLASPAWSQNHLRVKPDSCHKKPAEQPLKQVLPCYLIQPDDNFQWQIISQSDTADGKVALYKIDLISLRWDPGAYQQAGIDYPVWHHRITLYTPKEVKHNTALLYINGGSLYPDVAPSEPNNQSIDYLKIAQDSQSVVVELRDIPNQSLGFNGTPPLKEDALIAFTWEKFLEDPQNNRHWPLRLPMVKGTIRAMDAVQDFLSEKHITVNQFVVSGGSKRGWTAWLTAAMDNRASAVVPMVIDVLNLRPSMEHHYAAYGHWALAVKDYIHLIPTPDQLHSPEMKALLEIVDPYSYKDQLTMPKYIVNASADDFFLPDSSRFYFKDLPNEKWIRVLPNLRHYIVRANAELVTDTLESFYGAFLSKRKMPEVHWQREGDQLIVNTSEMPKNARLWQASNPSRRDFRVTPDNPDVTPFTPIPVKLDCQKQCLINLTMEPAKKGWNAYFLEITFANGTYPDLVLTTRVFIAPETYPKSMK